MESNLTSLLNGVLGMLDQLAIFVKAALAGAAIVVAFSAIYIYRVWSKDTSRKVRIAIMGFSIELGEAKDKPLEAELPPAKDIIQE